MRRKEQKLRMNRGEQERAFLIRGMKYILAGTHGGEDPEQYGVASHSIVSITHSNMAWERVLVRRRGGGNGW